MNSAFFRVHRNVARKIGDVATPRDEISSWKKSELDLRVEKLEIPVDVNWLLSSNAKNGGNSFGADPVNSCFSHSTI
jgi:hypothetical protein